jgi:hypothetical protein
MSSIANISLYIPHIFENISKVVISDTFEKLKIGKVSHVDLINKIGRDSKSYNAAYIHFDYWFNNNGSRIFQEKVVNPEKEARIIYEEPWYWVILENKGKKHIVNGRKICIDLGTKEEINGSHENSGINNTEIDNFVEEPDQLDQEMEQILDEMEYTEAFMPVECVDYVDSDYAEALENQITNLLQTVKYLGDALQNECEFNFNRNQELDRLRKLCDYNFKGWQDLKDRL